jgi:hypothetical protein
LAVVLERCVGQKLKPLDCLGTNRSDTIMSAPQRYELAPIYLIELHAVPVSQGRIAGYRVGG